MTKPLPLIFNAPRRGKPPVHLADLDGDARKKAVTEAGQPAFRADQLARHYFGGLTRDPGEMSDLPAGDRQVGHLGGAPGQAAEIVAGQLVGAEGRLTGSGDGFTAGVGIEVGQVDRRLAAAGGVEDQRKGFSHDETHSPTGWTWH